MEMCPFLNSCWCVIGVRRFLAWQNERFKQFSEIGLHDVDLYPGFPQASGEGSLNQPSMFILCKELSISINNVAKPLGSSCLTMFGEISSGPEPGALEDLITFVT